MTYLVRLGPILIEIPTFLKIRHPLWIFPFPNFLRSIFFLFFFSKSTNGSCIFFNTTSLLPDLNLFLLIYKTFCSFLKQKIKIVLSNVIHFQLLRQIVSYGLLFLMNQRFDEPFLLRAFLTERDCGTIKK